MTMEMLCIHMGFKTNPQKNKWVGMVTDLPTRVVIAFSLIKLTCTLMILMKSSQIQAL